MKKQSESLGISTLADIRRLEAIPLADRALPETVLDALKLGATRAEGRDALVFMPDAKRPDRVMRYSFDKLIAEVERAAGLFISSTGHPDPVVSIVMPNLPETHFTLWGAQMAGRANPINPLLEPEKMADIMRAAGTDILVTLGPTPGTDIHERAIAAATLAKVGTVLTVNASRYALSHKRIAAKLLARKASVPKWMHMRDYTKAARKAAGSVPKRRGSEVSALFHTGGTTGVPKIAQLTHANQVFIAWAGAANRFMQNHKAIFCGLPLFHVNGALVTGLVSWMQGATVVLGPPSGFRSPGLIENFWTIVEMHRIGSLSAVPTIYRMLLDVPIDGADLSSLEFGICGAAPISAHTLQTFQDRTGLVLLEGYGCTEGSCISTVTPGYGDARIGRIAFALSGLAHSHFRRREVSHR